MESKSSGNSFKSKKLQITVIRFADAHKATTAANPRPMSPSRSSGLSHCFKQIKAISKSSNLYLNKCNIILHFPRAKLTWLQKWYGSVREILTTFWTDLKTVSEIEDSELSLVAFTTTVTQFCFSAIWSTEINNESQWPKVWNGALNWT